MTTDRLPPAGRISRYAVGRVLLASLLAGRSSYRLATLATAVLLLPVWGPERFGVYAAAMASLSWLLVLMLTGPEKTVLKLLPRAARVGAALTDALVAVLWWLPLPVAACFVVVWARGGSERPVIYLGVAAMFLSVGSTMLLVGLHRAAGHPRSDAFSFLVMSVAQLALLGAAAAGLGPPGFVGAVIAVQLGINLALSATLGRPSLRIRRRPRLLWRLGWTAALLGSAELFVYLPTAVLMAVLAASAHADQVALLYIVIIVWSAGANLLLYLFRVYAPRTSLRLVGVAGRAGRAQAARLAGWVAAVNAVWLLVAGTVVSIAELAEVGTATGQVVVWVGLLATRAPAVVGLLWASYRLENTDATAPRVVALAAIAGVAVASAIGPAAVAALGGTGLLLSTAAGELGYALVLAALAARRQAPVNRAGVPLA